MGFGFCDLRFMTSKLLVPLSILLSGIIVALAILVSNNKIALPLLNQPPVPLPQPAIETQKEAAPPSLNIDLGTNSPWGNPQAKVKIVEFGDFQCPYCEQFFKVIEPQIRKDFLEKGTAVLAYRDLIIIDNFVPQGHESKDAALAARCAGEQNQFWAYHDKLFENQKGENVGSFKVANLKKFAVDLKLNATQFNQCLEKRKYDAQVQADTTTAVSYGVGGTPTIFINGQFFKEWNNYPALKTFIESKISR